ncbi:hypothetical protein M3Y99_00788100 [Aphelenchoides fujianensis]|nr:hypothetical protein M3Y99_00788100 [Aphelenchoides fujianensis]
MKSFNGAEVSFSYTNFPAKVDRNVDLKTDSPVPSLSMAELPDTGGSYSFPDDGSGFFNRVLFWRTEGSRIHFNEISATRDVNEPSLSLDLRPSMIIPGTSVTYHRGILILVIPTSSASPPPFDSRGRGRRPEGVQSDFASFYDHYFLANGVTARRVAINCDFRGDTVALVANNKGQLSVIRMPFFYSTGQSGSETRRSPPLAVNMSAFEKQMFAFSVQSDGKLRAWSVQDALFKAHYGLVEGLRSDAAFDVEDVQVKTFTAGKRNVVVVMMQLLKKVRFLFLSFNDDQFDFLTSCDLSHTAVVDFACVPLTATSNFVTLWAITRESYEENERSDAMFQPRGLESSSWDAVDPGMPDPIVQRAVQTVCKCPTIPVNYRDWPALSNFTEGFVQSGQFKQMYLMDTDRKLMLSTSNVDQASLKCCNQFQETLLAPVAIWHSPSLGLVGTIQQSRFTIYVPPDQEMRAMVTANSELVDPLVEADAVKLQSLIKMDVDVVCKIIKRFAESHVQHSEIKLERLKSSYLNSAFSTALLSTALRYRVLGRLCFAKIISMLIKLVPAAFAKANRTVDQRFNAVVNSHLAGILATIKHYNTLWLTLSTTFLNLGQGGRAPKLNTIAQAFFTNGMVSISQAADFIDDDLDEQEPSGGKTIALCEFDGFVNRALDCAMVAFKYYEALKDYCKQNEPFTTDLSAAFHFFQGIALVGVGLPAAAASFFEEASQGIVAGDEPLNGVLYHYTKQEPPYQHTLTDFYCVVMTIYKLQNQAEYVIRTGIFALSFAAEDDPLRPTIYTSLFTQYVATEQFLEAIRVLHLNPSPTSQENCLRNLIANLCDKSKTKALVTLHYGKLTDQVAELLETKCSTMPPMSDSGFFETVYAFYIHRYNYEAAARVMYNLCWRLRWEPQSREVLEKRERVLACVTQTVELLPPNHAIEFDLRGLCANGDRGLGMEIELQNVSKADLYNEYLLLEARTALVETGSFPEGPKLQTHEVYEAAVQHKLYDLAHFDLEITPLIKGLTLDCIGLGDETPRDAPNWLFTNCRFVDFGATGEEEALAAHWKLLVALVDLSLKHNPADVRVLHPITNLLLERSLPIPKWLERRYAKVNCRYFLHQLIEFDELPYAFEVLNTHLEKASKQKLTAKDLCSIPLTQANALLVLSDEQALNRPELTASADKSRKLLKKMFSLMQFSNRLIA